MFPLTEFLTNVSDTKKKKKINLQSQIYLDTVLRSILSDKELFFTLSFDTFCSEYFWLYKNFLNPILMN